MASRSRQLLKRPEFRAKDLPLELLSLVPIAIWQLIETDFKCEGYAARQSDQNRQLDRRQQQADSKLARITTKFLAFALKRDKN